MLYLVNCLPPFHLALFLESSSVLSFEICFFFSPFCLSLCDCFYVLNRSAMTPRLGGAALCSKCLVGPSGAVSLITWAGCSRNVPCVSHRGHHVGSFLMAFLITFILFWFNLNCIFFHDNLVLLHPPPPNNWFLITVVHLWDSSALGLVDCGAQPWPCYANCSTGTGQIKQDKTKQNKTENNSTTKK